MAKTVQKTSIKGSPYDVEGSNEIQKDAPLPLRALLTCPVLLSVTNYAFLCLIEIAYRAIQPLFYSTPIELGGLGQSPAWIGILMSSFGILNGIVQALYFPTFIEWWGPKRMFMTGMAMFNTIFILFPIMNTLARQTGMSSAVYFLLFLQLAVSVVSDMSYGEISGFLF